MLLGTWESAGYLSSALPDGEDGGPGWGWGVQLLPYMEQGAAFDALDLAIPLANDQVATLRTQVIPGSACPSDGEVEDVIDITEKLVDAIIHDSPF